MSTSTVTVDRTVLLRGPMSAGYNSATFLSESDALLKFMKEFSTRKSSGFGDVRRPIRDKWLEMSFSPLNFDSLAVLYPYTSLQIGDRLCGASDLPLIVTPRNGTPITVVNAIITKMPSIKFATAGSMLGPVGFEGLCGENADPSVEASYFTMGSPASNVALAGYNLAKILNRRYTLTYNGLTIVPNEGGFQVEFEQSNKMLRPDISPRLDYSLQGLTARIRFTPSVVTNAVPASNEAVYTTAMNFGANIGDDETLANAVIAGDTTGDPKFTLNNCQVVSGELRYGEADRQGEVVLEAIPLVTSNALAARWAFSTV